MYTRTQRKDELKDQLHKLAGQINKAKFAHEPAGKLKREFAKLSAQYKRLVITV